MGAIFEPAMSVGPEEDMITSLNLVVAVSQCHAICAVIAKMTKSNNDEAICTAKTPSLAVVLSTNLATASRCSTLLVISEPNQERENSANFTYG